MKFASYTQFFRDREERGIEYAASHAASLGFDAVEYFGRVPSDIGKTAAREREILSAYGLEVACYSVLARLFTENPKETEEKMKREIEAAALLGSPYFHHTVFPNYTMKTVENSFDEVLAGVVEPSEKVAKECNRYHITCLYEPQGVYFNGIYGLDRLLSEMKLRGCEVGICGDFGNSLFVDIDPIEIFRHFSADIRHVHVKDYRLTDIPEPNKRTYESLGGRLIYDAPLGTGVVDFREGFRLLAACGYNGTVSLELDGEDEEILRSLSLVRELATI